MPNYSTSLGGQPPTWGSNSPFDAIRHVDSNGREYWLGREIQPHMGYADWPSFADVIEKARASLAIVSGQAAADKAFAEASEVKQIHDGDTRPPGDYRITRFGAYLTAMAGDDTKPAVARARVYFAVRTREAELGELTVEEIRRTALARAREMTDYKTFRDMMVENATDYVPSTPASRLFFANMQNRLYRHITGLSAAEIKNARPICHWKGRETGKLTPTKADREVAKNYLTVSELNKLNRLVGRLCLRAEDIAEDGLSLPLSAWEDLVDAELAIEIPRRATA